MKAALVKTLHFKQEDNIQRKSSKQTKQWRGKKEKKNIAEVACRRALLKRSSVAAAGKYLWSCHGTRSRLRILFKQSLSEHREGDGDTVSLGLPCGPLSQHHTLGKQWSHAGTGAVQLKIAERDFGKRRELLLWGGSPGLGLRMELVDWGSKVGYADWSWKGWKDVQQQENGAILIFNFLHIILINLLTQTELRRLLLSLKPSRLALNSICDVVSWCWGGLPLGGNGYWPELHLPLMWSV